MHDIDPRDLFFTQTDLDLHQAVKFTENALHGADDGELYLEYTLSEAFSFDDNRLKAASFDTAQGFGLRAVNNEAVGYAHATDLTPAALKRAADSLSPVLSGHQGTWAQAPNVAGNPLYVAENPLDSAGFTDKVALLNEINAYTRARDNRVRQVSVSLSGEWQAVGIIRPDSAPVFDIRPLVRLDVSVVVGEGDRQETGHSGRGGRAGYAQWLAPENWQQQADNALRQALTNLESIPAPAGEMDVVLGPGWPGILLHEAVGHGLEGDFNRKGTSAFSGRIGEQVASKGVTVIDDGTLADRRGSLTVDDEGTPTDRTVLIEDGVLTDYMQDRMNARLMGMKPTGNGRRESFACQPMPRMTNTFMLGGEHDPQEILDSVKNGIYATAFGGGQVDITSGKFVFSCTEAYEIKDGKLGAPLKGATLIGTGSESMQRISMIGNDMTLDEGIGTCGKAGQGVPVGVGQPTLRIDGLTVGGTG
ncbi:MAG: metalloprotease TldD [Rhizobiales bacterium TMED83]|nr:metalloprotease TldD [Rhodobiaceae bacterium]RPF94414.1 MAG: metalloprotease TldD [Rhizobiales bacterium TMED83]